MVKDKNSRTEIRIFDYKTGKVSYKILTKEEKRKILEILKGKLMWF